MSDVIMPPDETNIPVTVVNVAGVPSLRCAYPTCCLAWEGDSLEEARVHVWCYHPHEYPGHPLHETFRKRVA
jgi:hypothetical protein